MVRQPDSSQNLDQLSREGNRRIAGILRDLMVVSNHPIDTQPWSMGDSQLREQLAKAVRFLGGEKDIGRAGRAALRLSKFNLPEIRSVLDLAFTQAEQQAVEGIINIRLEMERRGLSEK